MGVWVIGHVTVKDPRKWAEYRSKVPATLLQCGGEVIFRGSRTAVLTGESRHPDVVVIRFPDASAALEWYRSPVYQALIPLREQAADMVLVSYES
jgi:uncharacterized protein (DUF1330 family)